MAITFQQLSDFIKSGYTEDQIKDINRIMSGSAEANPTTSPAPAPAPAPEPSTPPDADPKNPKPAAEESETVTMLKEMLGLMRKGNINIGRDGTPEEKAEDILASLINP